MTPLVETGLNALKREEPQNAKNPTIVALNRITSTDNEHHWCRYAIAPIGVAATAPDRQVQTGLNHGTIVLPHRLASQ